MGINFRDKVNDSVKDNKDYLDKEKDKDKINEISDIDTIMDLKDDRLKNNDKDNKVIQETYKEKKDSKWDKIDWNKDLFTERRESKWAKINWSKNLFEERKENRCNKKYSNNEKFEEYIKENLEEYLMSGEDYDKSIGDMKKSNENLEDKDKNEEFLERIEEKLNEYEFEKIFVKNIEEKLNKSHLKETIKEKGDSRESNYDSKEEIKDDIEYKNLINEKLQEKFKEYYDETGKYANWGTNIRKDFLKRLEQQIQKKNIPKYKKDSLDQINKMIDNINRNQEIQRFVIDKIKNHSTPYSKIIQKIKKIGLSISYEKINQIAKLQTGDQIKILSQKDYKWKFLDYDNNRNLLIYEKCVKRAAEYLSKTILTNEYRKDNNLRNNQAPTTSILKKDHGDFINALKRRKIFYNDVLREAGLELNKDPGKFSFLDKKRDDTSLIYDESVQKAAEYLNKKILTDEYKKTYNLGINQAPTIQILRNEHYDFVSALLNRNILYNDVLSNVGLVINKDPRKFSFLDKKNDGTPLTYDESVQKAAEYLKKKILTDEYRQDNNLGQYQAPTTLILRNRYADYVNGIKRRKIFYNDILRQAGLELNKEHGKFSFLDKKNDGTPLTYDESVQKATEYLKKKILTDEYRQDNNLGQYQAPTTLILRNRYADYVNAIEHRNISYNDILRQAGLELNKEHGKFSFLDKKNDGTFLTYDESVQKAAEYLKKKILTYEYKNTYNLESNQAPTLDNLSQEHIDLVGALKRRNISYNDVLDKANLEINYDPRKWKFLDEKRDKTPLTYDESVQKAAEYLNKKILTDEYKKTYNLGINQAPTAEMLEIDHMDFASAIKHRNLLFNDILEGAGYEPHEILIFQQAGNYRHIIEERIFLEHTREKGVNSFYEAYTNIYTDKKDYPNYFKNYGLSHGDNCCIIDLNFKNLSIEAKNLYYDRNDIKMIIIDYYLGNSPKNTKDHCLRGYQGKEKMLIIIPSFANKAQAPPQDIPFRKKVKVLDPDTFSDLIGFDDRLKNELKYAIKLANDATWKNDGSMNELRRLAKESRKIIRKKYNFGQKELEDFIKKSKSLSNILKYNPDRSTVDGWIA